jgi:hypothetical protein
VQGRGGSSSSVRLMDPAPGLVHPGLDQTCPDACYHGLGRLMVAALGQADGPI